MTNNTTQSTEQLSLRRGAGRARRRTAAVVGLGAMTALAACSTGAGATSSSSSPPAATVSIGGMNFSPSVVKIKSGGIVTWSWTAGRAHDVHLTDGSISPIQASGTWSHTFTTPGSYSFHCDLHPRMTGTVIVS
ncbi:MAG TPA: plastocyanin/azurin family copper-binding protein [Acidimicrobiia bacterium]|nr:plastocyanin/azurin family copper-binding protein [Acidimicrobiia bacterium]